MKLLASLAVQWLFALGALIVTLAVYWTLWAFWGVVLDAAFGPFGVRP